MKERYVTYTHSYRKQYVLEGTYQDETWDVLATGSNKNLYILRHRGQHMHVASYMKNVSNVASGACCKLHGER